MRTTNWLKRLASTLAAAVVLSVPSLLPASVAYADPGAEGRLLELTNESRAAAGLPALSVDASLTSVASQWAANMAAQGSISHNNALPRQVKGWKQLAENVGVGGSVDAVHDGFLNSATHRENILDPAVSRVGFGVVRVDARIYVVENFIQPADEATASASAAPVASSTTSPPSRSRASTAQSAPLSPVTAAPAASIAPSTRRTGTRPPAPTGPTPWLVLAFDTLRSLDA